MQYTNMFNDLSGHHMYCMDVEYNIIILIENQKGQLYNNFHIRLLL